MLYARNIAVDDEEYGDDLKARVRKFVKLKQDFRIVSIQVVHNRYCEDTVGCKLCVPVSAMEKRPENNGSRRWRR